MREHTRKQIRTAPTQQRIEIWRPLFPGYSDAELAEVIYDIDDYLRIAWQVFRTRHPDEDLPDQL